jgi:hypothetical protein
MAANRANLKTVVQQTSSVAPVEPTFWDSLTPLEKVGTVAVGVVGTAALVVFLAPGLASAATGGALTAGGAWFLKKGFGK